MSYTNFPIWNEQIDLMTHFVTKGSIFDLPH